MMNLSNAYFKESVLFENNGDCLIDKYTCIEAKIQKII